MDLLTSCDKCRDNYDRMERMRSRLLNSITMRFLLLPVFSAMGLPKDYSIWILSIAIVPSTTDKEVDHTIQIFSEEARRQLMSVSL